jgi:hypothetical protein
LIDKLKCKVFSLDPEFTLAKEKSPLIQIYETKQEIVEALHERSLKKVAVYSPTQRRVTPDYLFTSGRRSLHENSLPLPEHPVTDEMKIDERD